MACFLHVISHLFLPSCFKLYWLQDVLVPVLQAFPIIFIVKHGFTIAQSGLIFIGIGIGSCIGTIINHYTSRHYPELMREWKGFPPPENRLFGAMIGSFMLVIGIFWLGWTGEYVGIPWYVPALSTIFTGAGINLIFMSFLVRMVHCFIYLNCWLYLLSRVTSLTHICMFQIYCAYFSHFMSFIVHIAPPHSQWTLWFGRLLLRLFPSLRFSYSRMWVAGVSFWYSTQC